MKHVYFFALSHDITRVLNDLESIAPIRYVRMGQYDTEKHDTFEAAGDIPLLGQSDTDSASSGRSFLLVHRFAQVHLRSVDVQGKKRFIVDQLVNSDSIVLSPGGSWTGDIVISGRFATTSSHTFAQTLMKKSASLLRKQFTKVKAFYVGAEAMTLLREGKRLTDSARSPVEYDLRLV